MSWRWSCSLRPSWAQRYRRLTHEKPLPNGRRRLRDVGYRNRFSPGTFVLGYKLSPTDVREVMTVADAFGATELPTVRITE